MGHPSIRPIKLGALRLLVRVSTVPRRDIVGKLVLLHHFLYKPIKNSKIHKKILNYKILLKYVVKSLVKPLLKKPTYKIISKILNKTPPAKLKYAPHIR